MKRKKIHEELTTEDKKRTQELENSGNYSDLELEKKRAGKELGPA